MILELGSLQYGGDRNSKKFSEHFMAGQVLSDLGKAKGFAGFARNPEIIAEHRRKEWMTAIKCSENFFKHAGRDDTATHEFNAIATRFTILEAVWMLRWQTGKLTWETLVYSMWFSIAYPDMILACEFKRVLQAESTRLNLHSDELSFFADMLNMKHLVPPHVLSGVI